MGFNHIMLHTDVAGALKVGRLTPAERWAWVAGVLCIAGKADERGTLTIGDGLAATAEDVAKKADVPLSVARATLAKLRELGMLHADERGVEYVHDWDEHQPKPKRDVTAAERKRKQRERAQSQAGHGDVTPASRRDGHDVTPPEVEGEVEGEVTAPGGPTIAGTRPHERGPLTGGVLR